MECWTAARAFMAITVLGLTLGGCATAPGSEADMVTIPYSYRQLGAAPQPDILVLDKGHEDAAVSQAIIEGLQAFNLSIASPPMRADTVLKANQSWDTAIADLDPNMLARYNAEHPAAPLPSTVTYGLEFTGTYAVMGAGPSKGQLRFALKSTLYKRGDASGGAYHPCTPTEYIGLFFAKAFRDFVQKRLAAHAGVPIT